MPIAGLSYTHLRGGGWGEQGAISCSLPLGFPIIPWKFSSLVFAAGLHRTLSPHCPVAHSLPCSIPFLFHAIPSIVFHACGIHPCHKIHVVHHPIFHGLGLLPLFVTTRITTLPPHIPRDIPPKTEIHRGGERDTDGERGRGSERSTETVRERD